MHKISFTLDPTSIGRAISQVKDYQKQVRAAGPEIAKRLARRGYSVAHGVMSGHVFSGETLESLEVVQESENTYILRAGSQAILFFEFGAGARYGGGHPWDGKFHMGPGTYPGAGHWDDPDGWWFPTDDPRLILTTDDNGQGWGHSYGNKPYMPFYKASRAMKDDLMKIAKEVFYEIKI